MALTSSITKTLNIPGESIQVTVRKLSHHQVMMARDAQIDRLTGMMRKFEGIELPKPADGDAEKRAPGTDLDRATVLRCGIVDWTYPVALDDANRDDLDEDTAQWLFEQIVAFSLRSDDERKNSSDGLQLITGRAEAAGLPS